MLRIGVWTVCSLAVIGNLSLFFVTLVSAKKWDSKSNISVHVFLTVCVLFVFTVDTRYHMLILHDVWNDVHYDIFLLDFNVWHHNHRFNFSRFASTLLASVVLFPFYEWIVTLVDMCNFMIFVHNQNIFHFLILYS